MIKQISVYTENKKGAARQVFSILAKEKINVLSLVNSDSGEFGTMRIIVSDSEKAMAELKNSGYLCKLDYVIAAVLDDEPGALETFLRCIEDMYINIEYMYVGYMRKTCEPVILVHCSEMDIVESALVRNGYKIY